MLFRAITLRTCPAVAAACALTGSAMAQTTDRINLTNSGGQTVGTASGGSITPSGRFVVFTSTDSLVPGAPAAGVGGKVYVRDRFNNTTSWISQPDPSQVGAVPNGGSQAATGSLRTISDNGRYVIFQSSAENLVANDTNGVPDIFVRDRDVDNDGVFDEAGAGNVRTVRVSLTSSESESFGACPNFTCSHQSYEGGISANGRYVIWESAFGFDSTLDGGGFINIYWRDRDADNDGIFDETGGNPNAAVTHLVGKRVTCSGCSPDGFSAHGVISADGRWVAFDSADTHLIFSDNNDAQDVFVRDMFNTASNCVRLSVSSTGDEGNNQDSTEPAISSDGRFVAFATNRGDIVPDDGPSTDIVVRDRDADNDDIFDEAGAGAQTIELVSLGFFWQPLPGGSDVALNGFSGSPAISGDGRYVAFHSDATNFNGQVLGNVDTNGQRDILVRDRTLGVTSRASVSSNGEEANDRSDDPYIDNSGRWVSFRSEATNLLKNQADTNGATVDVYVNARRSDEANSTCAGTLSIVENQSYTGDTYGAGTEGATSCTTGTAPDVFFSFTAGCTGEITFDTLGSSYDTVLSVHSACPGTSQNALGCNDDIDAGSGNLRSRVSLFVGQGETYIVRLSGFNNDAGFYILNVSQCQACCIGNADRIQPGSVAFSDITSVLLNFNNAYMVTGPGDADCNGQVVFADITTVLLNFNSPCN